MSTSQTCSEASKTCSTSESPSTAALDNLGASHTPTSLTLRALSPQRRLSSRSLSTAVSSGSTTLARRRRTTGPSAATDLTGARGVSLASPASPATVILSRESKRLPAPHIEWKTLSCWRSLSCTIMMSLSELQTKQYSHWQRSLEGDGLCCTYMMVVR